MTVCVTLLHCSFLTTLLLVCPPGLSCLKHSDAWLTKQALGIRHLQPPRLQANDIRPPRWRCLSCFRTCIRLMHAPLTLCSYVTLRRSALAVRSACIPFRSLRRQPRAYDAVVARLPHCTPCSSRWLAWLPVRRAGRTVCRASRPRLRPGRARLRRLQQLAIGARRGAGRGRRSAPVAGRNASAAARPRQALVELVAEQRAPHRGQLRAYLRAARQHSTPVRMCSGGGAR